ncbi:MAG: aconitase X [Candidatus Parvarchaeota archaeon]|nr:aconitase X [Candidatus Jingweiarchaeum tengchongense]MCW1298276.1 aconitase X [Candidatus Jingweiarchaeum tengchongense]MCW1300367.1 aconitase X [Candidatus Jingweiarchaeum tengchongense]MCW1304788.1 aconitase X [Candidatus Jingweiarchaeum tengchongense]MCW1305378.1 aconitase X [Candidatus Jingweiarchaeum tengchongense]
MIRTKQPVSFLDGFDPKRGVITQKGHELEGKSIANEIVELPYSVGSTVGTYKIFESVRYGKAPRAFILQKPDPIILPSMLVGIQVKIKGKKKVRKKIYIEEIKGIDNKLLAYLKREAELANAEKLIKIDSAQVAGVSYKTCGDGGLEFVKKMIERKLKVRVMTTLNPAGMDLEKWEEMKIPERFAERQLELINYFKMLGIEPTCTCTPYLIGNCPRFGSHIAWAESSAVCFANSCLGCKTNREGSAKSLVSALTGLTPYYGLHKQEERNPSIEIDVQTKLRNVSDFSTLGFFIGKVCGDKIPIIKGVKKISIEGMKSLCAASAASGAVSLLHIENITPEIKLKKVKPKINEKFSFGKNELKKVYDELNSTEKVDLIAIGCPHASINEVREVAMLLKNRKLKNVDLWICTSREIKKICERKGFVKKIEKSGGMVVADTCMVVSPIEEMGYRYVATNSCKAAKYLPSFCKQKVFFSDIKNIINKFSI